MIATPAGAVYLVETTTIESMLLGVLIIETTAGIVVVFSIHPFM